MTTTPASMGEPLSEAERLGDHELKWMRERVAEWQSGKEPRPNQPEIIATRLLDELDRRKAAFTEELRDLIRKHDAKVQALRDENWAMAEQIAKLGQELNATKRAKQENDERFMTERDKARARVGVLEGQLAKAADPVNGPVQLAIHRAVCEDSLAHCVENRGRCVRSAEAASWALGLDGSGSDE